MENNYYDATGVLVLDKVTPVISALFGGFKLDASYPGNGEAYIARISEANKPSWDEVFENLKDLAESLSLSCSERDTESISAILQLLSRHFNAVDDEALRQLIEHRDFRDTDVGLDTLFVIATRFDDGHGLQAIKWEGAWHCSRPRLFEFAGNGLYISKSVYTHSNSSQALLLGADLHAAIRDGNLNQAAIRLAKEVASLLASVTDEAICRTLRRKLTDFLRYEGRSLPTLKRRH